MTTTQALTKAITERFEVEVQIVEDFGEINIVCNGQTHMPVGTPEEAFLKGFLEGLKVKG